MNFALPPNRNAQNDVTTLVVAAVSDRRFPLPAQRGRCRAPLQGASRILTRRSRKQTGRRQSAVTSRQSVRAELGAFRVGRGAASIKAAPEAKRDILPEMVTILH